MKISIFGTGYVGLVTGSCLAEVGHEVLCVDTDNGKLERIRCGDLPIFEPGLERLVEENIKFGRLDLTSDAGRAINFADVIMIAVGTPPDEDGSADISHVLDVARSVGDHMDGDKTIFIKSTVPVGTADLVRSTIAQRLIDRNENYSMLVASNPEFLKEGAAVSDFMDPDRIVIGTDCDDVKKIAEAMYAPFNRRSNRILFMDIRSSELTKYAANAMLATKISFMNEMANLAEKLGADVEQVRQGIGSDPRIGYQFIYPGCGYGGSCFPKDVRALIHSARHHHCDLSVLSAVESANEAQKHRIFELIMKHYGNDISSKVFAVWGLAFKPNTDDMREASSRVLIEQLWQAGARVQAYDPKAMQEAERIFGQRNDLTLLGTSDAALVNADALVICTDWQSFKAPDFDRMASRLTDKVIFDGRNLYDPEVVRGHQLSYYGIGRGDSVEQKPFVNGLSSALHGVEEMTQLKMVGNF